MRWASERTARERSSTAGVAARSTRCCSASTASSAPASCSARAAAARPSYVECLARAGRLEDEQLAFEKMLTYANHLGLYSEHVGPTGELLGNFPQAFTHLALISAPVNLDRQLRGASRANPMTTNARTS
jgi:hypothetical protein